MADLTWWQSFAIVFVVAIVLWGIVGPWQYDIIKNEYAVKRGIPLVRIPYSEKGAITLDLLFSDKYLVSA